MIFRELLFLCFQLFWLLCDWLHERLGEDFSPKAERVAANRGEEHPDCGVDSPYEALRCVGAAFALDGVHYADNIVLGCCLGLEYIAVSKKCDGVFVHLYNPVNQVVTVCVEYECNHSFAQVFLFPWAEGHLVAQVDHERVHAVSFDSE